MDSNPAATLYAAQVSLAASTAAGVQPIPSEEILTITGTLGGVIPEHPAEIMTGGPIVNVTQGAAAAPGVDVNALIKLALLIVIASWAGSALFSGRNS